MRRKPTFDDRLEALLDEATPEQLRRILDLAGFALRRDQRAAGLAVLQAGPVWGPWLAANAPTREIPHAPTPGPESETA